MAKKKINENLSYKEKNAMNDDLKQWLSEEDQAQLSKNIKTRIKEKRPIGMCQVCGKNSAKTVCIKCGKSVCNSCYFHMVGLCEKCLSKETVDEWKKKKPNWKKILELDWFD